LPHAVRLVRGLASIERRRLAEHSGRPVVEGYRPLSGTIWRRARIVATDATAWRDLGWLAVHAILGLVFGGLTVLLLFAAARDATMPLWWWAVPEGTANNALGTVVTDWPMALMATAAAPAYLSVAAVLLPWLARIDLVVSAAFLAPGSAAVLEDRVRVLTESRTAALTAHEGELRRIERDLHDAAQNRLIAVTMLLGMARREAGRRPERVPELMAEAQRAAENALVGLRAVIRGVHPPALTELGLDGAVMALAAGSPVPCQVDIGPWRRAPMPVESAAYHVIAEALTNAARHSGADRIRVDLRRDGDNVVVRITDDGRGGAVERPGGGLAGLRGRVTALDGRMAVESPEGGPTVVRVELSCGS